MEGLPVLIAQREICSCQNLQGKTIRLTSDIFLSIHYTLEK